ncbi:3-dehydroquinate synthase, partial [Flavobacteriales bacterium]|nr:3-dehydroquinate synthase [Flavobacteriales bacterium]
MKVVHSSTYDIKIGKCSLQNIHHSRYSAIAILVDEHTKTNCLDIFLKESQISPKLIIEIHSGEKNKNIFSCEQIWQQLTTAKFDRKSLLINLGGGVVGDMGGFAASCYKRGIDFIQVPTTLLAMVDASVGGKLAIDLENFKNQIGLFKSPKG